MTQDEMKQAVARAARDYVAEYLPLGAILGVGTGSTANYFIDRIAGIKDRLGGTVASSEATARRLAGHGMRVLDLNDVEVVGMYVDGADEIDGSMAMVKGGGGALTREKIVAAVAGLSGATLWRWAPRLLPPERRLASARSAQRRVPAASAASVRARGRVTSGSLGFRRRGLSARWFA